MKIKLTDEARNELKKFKGAAPAIRLSIIDGCCGKSFEVDKIHAPNETDEVAHVDDIIFVMDKNDVKIAPEITIDHPGPIDGFMITNLNAVGGCGCGRSFFVDEG